MELGTFYFISDEYFTKFDGNNLMDNKEDVDGEPHNRLCYYSFKEPNSEILWMIPISSKVDKYEEIYQDKIEKYPNYDGILFGYVLGEKCAFLIQNLCPVINRYILNQYINKATASPVLISESLKSEINSKVRKAIRLYRKGIKIVFPHILDIENVLLDELKDLDEVCT